MGGGEKEHLLLIFCLPQYLKILFLQKSKTFPLCAPITSWGSGSQIPTSSSSQEQAQGCE